MANPPTTPSTLTRLDLWFRRHFPQPRMRVWLGVLVLGAVAFFTREKVTVPFVVGWQAAETLVAEEEEIERLQRETLEYRSAAAFFETEEGRDYAQKLLYDQLKPGERRITVEPGSAAGKQGVGRRLGGWVQDKERGLETSWQHTRKVIRRCFVDPPPPAKSEDKARGAKPPSRPRPD